MGIYSQDLGIEFFVEKCAIRIMKNGKQYTTEGIDLPSQDKVRTIGGMKAYKYSGILEADTIIHSEMKEKN